MREPDVVVVGAGGGGPAATLRLAEVGLDVLVLEAGPFYGNGQWERPHERSGGVVRAVPARALVGPLPLLVAVERPGLEHEHIEAGLGEPQRRGRPAAAGADDDHVGVPHRSPSSRRSARASGSPSSSASSSAVDSDAPSRSGPRSSRNCWTS